MYYKYECINIYMYIYVYIHICNSFTYRSYNQTDMCFYKEDVHF